MHYIYTDMKKYITVYKKNDLFPDFDVLLFLVIGVHVPYFTKVLF